MYFFKKLATMDFLEGAEFKSRNLDSQNFRVKFALVKHETERDILLISSDYYMMIDKRLKYQLFASSVRIG